MAGLKRLGRCGQDKVVVLRKQRIDRLISHDIESQGNNFSGEMKVPGRPCIRKHKLWECAGA